MTITALVINLDTATDRWQFQQQQLTKLAINFQRLRASQVDELTDSEYQRWANDWQRKLRQTEVACFLSHYRAWQQVIEHNQPLLILEDDALLSSQTTELLSVLDSLPTLPFEHLTLETRGRKKLFNQVGDKIDEIVNGVNLHRLWLDKTGACAYILTPTGANKLINRVKAEGAGLADALLCEQPNRLNSMQAVPALAIQMDMMEHYGVKLPHLTHASTSNISTNAHSKPKANSKIDNVKFKYRRLNAQISMGMTQVKHRKQHYQEVMFDKEGLAYLQGVADE